MPEYEYYDETMGYDYEYVDAPRKKKGGMPDPVTVLLEIIACLLQAYIAWYVMVGHQREMEMKLIKRGVTTATGPDDDAGKNVGKTALAAGTMMLAEHEKHQGMDHVYYPIVTVACFLSAAYVLFFVSFMKSVSAMTLGGILKIFCFSCCLGLIVKEQYEEYGLGGSSGLAADLLHSAATMQEQMMKTDAGRQVQMHEGACATVQLLMALYIMCYLRPMTMDAKGYD